ncbi:adenylosuccinate synthetase [Candidatus Woesearchaeota archaeon]|nr:adenylosuccinate synthetase [Candidatus Woesearchaeota archaeon]
MIKKIALIGLQAGDEGKGKIETWFLEQLLQIAEPSEVMSERWHGADNAGHTVVVDGKKHHFHGLPSGLVYEGVFNLISGGCYVSPINLMNEITRLQGEGLTITSETLGIAANAGLKLEYHIAADKKGREKKGTQASSHTTTGSGVGPAAVDRYARTGMNLMHFMDEEFFRQQVSEKFPEGNIPVTRKEGDQVIIERKSLDEFVEMYRTSREFLRPFLVEETSARQGRTYRLYEGAHGADLDIITGMYRGATCSEPTRVPNDTDLIVGVFKLYESSVGWGDRAFPSYFGEELASQVRDIWGERGTTTGKPRDLGWFDIVKAKHNLAVTSAHEIVGTCGDRLTDLHGKVDKIKLVVGYEIDDQVYTEWQKEFADVRYLKRVKCVFEEFDTWERFTEDDGTLSENAAKYVNRIEELLGRKFSLLGTGPGSKQMIVYRNPLKRAG